MKEKNKELSKEINKTKAIQKDENDKNAAIFKKLVKCFINIYMHCFSNDLILIVFVVFRLK